MPADNLQHHLDIHRLGQMIVHPCRQCLRHIRGKSIRRHGDNRYGGRIHMPAGTYGFSGSLTIQYRHLDIHQHQVVVPRRRTGKFFHAQLTVSRTLHRSAGPL